MIQNYLQIKTLKYSCIVLIVMTKSELYFRNDESNK